MAEYFTLDLIPDPFLIVQKGDIIDINQGCAELLGLTKDELVGRHYQDIEPLRIFCEKVPDAVRNNAEDFDLVIRSGRHYEVFILPFRTSDGTDFLRIAFKDISNFVGLEKELLKRNKELIIINTLSSAFISSGNLDLVMENLLKKVLLVTDFTTGWLMLREGESFHLKTQKDLSSDFISALESGALDSLCDEIITAHEPLFVAEAAEISRYEILRRERLSFLTALPLTYEHDIFGILFLSLKGGRTESFNFDLAALLSLVGNHVAMILDKIKLFQETKRLSITDGLTGLYNSRYFYKFLDAEIARSKRYGSTFSLILFDIDNFKKLNDTHGHQAGDDVLHELARILLNVSRETDVVVRYGGEEFVIILPNTTEEDTINLADRIRTSVEQNVFLLSHAGGISITLSGGIASYPKNAGGVKALLNAADTAMYTAKRSGKNKVVCFRGRISE
ncbi:MAG: GGDEF domain-containing protein [Thermodesulfovibrionales bacterium]